MHTFTKKIFGLGFAVAGLLPWYFIYQYTADYVVKSARKNPDAPYDRNKGY